MFFTLSVGKQPRYVLPVLPPLALLLASSIIERTSEWRSRDGLRMRPRPIAPSSLGCVLGGAVSAGAGRCCVYRAQPLFLNVSDARPPGRGRRQRRLPALAVLVIVSFTRAWRAAPGVLALAAAVAFAVLPYGALPAPTDARRQRRWPISCATRARGDEAIGTYRVFVRNLVFYTGMKHTDIIHDEHLADWLTKNPGALDGDAARSKRIAWRRCPGCR